MPAVTQPGTNVPACSRCRHELRQAAQTSTPAISDAGIPLEEIAASPDDPVAKLSDWETDQRLRHLARTLRCRKSPATAMTATPPLPHYRWDSGPGISSGPPHPQSLPSLDRARVVPRRLPTKQASRTSQVLSWLCMLLGLTVFACGLGLGCQSLVHGESRLWQIAIGLALAGQGLLILALVMVLSWLWRNSRYATERLREMNGQLSEVQRAAQVMVGLQQHSAPAFYAELARGASPQMMLASLRGQLEQLATRMNG